VFRRDNKGDNFERQMGALRQQLGDQPNTDDEDSGDAFDDQGQAYDDHSRGFGYGAYGGDLPAAGVEATPPPPPSIPDVDATTTVIAHDTTWKGDMSSDGSVHIHGRFDGAVKAQLAIFVAEGAEVDATLTADAIIVAGTSRGTVRARGKFEVLPTGRVAGDIFSPTLIVHEGAVMSGQLRMTSEEPKDAKPTPVIQRRANRGTA
jgi:cytoskeletal protein CcmA (bactofilin family)